MTLEEFKNILKNGAEKEKHEAISNANSELLNSEIFFLLIELLKSPESHIRFFALYHLIDKFSESLTNIDDSLIGEIYNLLFDQFTPVVDKTFWALSIIGDRALDMLLDEYYKGDNETKIKITYAIGRGNFSHRSKDRIHVLLDGLKSKNIDIKFSSMCEIMSNTPIANEHKSEWNSVQDKTVDLEMIYDQVLLVAREFIELNYDRYQNSSSYYIKLIENKKSL
ncbi:HEAT repeat domain-containing protein [Sediminitomix flava]|uniref:HEAT repeat protein n=1 Tax=Sediminitomix flava TaxID=379075 RepID=A0A315Z7A5_SEDFL|nr:hypothetical protein [Sediminitomix flava]PWJ38655.1 hypothetical protein BC781_107246 [Sediminitomix flava]